MMQVSREMEIRDGTAETTKHAVRVALFWGVVVVAAAFVVLAAASVTGPAWLLVLGYAGHGAKDLWQHRRRYVAQTRWWPPFCLVVDWIVALVIAMEIVAGVHLHQ